MNLFAYLSGDADYRAERDGCGRTASCSPSDVSWTKTRLYVIAPIALGVGVGSLGAAAWLLFGPRSAPPPAAAALDLRVAPEGASVGFRGRF